jgi:hypothetical protein
MFDSFAAFEILDRRFYPGDLPIVDGKIFGERLLRERGPTAPCGPRQGIETAFVALSDPNSQGG